MDNELDFELENLTTQYDKLVLSFFNQQCKGCIGTQLQKDRKCGKLTGCDVVNCDLMEEWIHNQMKEEKEILATSLAKEASSKGE